ncbi:MAG: T9SS C-terminal target domain-containing protein [Chitinophagia bacterium]|nr:T9SS C-terminal target domain-containing protein [Chitinophagia bacterium]
MCDPDRDGWSSGSPSYFGDFVLRGGNQEGWSYMADGNQTNGWNKNADTGSRIPGMNCSHISYIDSGYLVKTTWQGVASGLYLTQITTVDTHNLYVKVQVIVENTTLSSFADVYYMRTINAHPDAASGSYTAVHKIEYTQPDSLNRALVSTRGIANSQSYISLSTTDDRAKAFIAKNDILPIANTIDNIVFGDTNFLYRKNDSVVGNVCIGLVYDLSSIPSGGSAVFTFYYNFVKKTDSTHIDAVNTVEQLPISLYPNPTSGSFSLMGITSGCLVNVYDPVGRKVAQFKTLHTGESYDISHLQTGCYALEVKNLAGMVVYRNSLVKY